MLLIKTVGLGKQFVEPAALEMYLLDALAALKVDDTEKARSILLNLKDQVNAAIPR